MHRFLVWEWLVSDPTLGEMFLRLGLTALFVGFIGIERQLRHKIAGVTTHLMVAFGACGVAILQEWLFNEAILQGDPNVTLENQRLIAQVIVGVGFLGAGTILKTSNGIYGLTTAATLWLGAMIGLCFGMGAYALGIVLSVVSFIFLTAVRKLLDLTAIKHVKSPEFLGSEIIEK